MRRAGVVAAPAFGFSGALSGLLVSATKGDWERVDNIELAFALARWRPSNGTRLAGARRAGRRLVVTGGRMDVPDPAQGVPRGTWRFSPPFGDQPNIGEFSTVDVVAITRHIPANSISTWINEAPIADLNSPDPSYPEASDESGRSAQQFVIEAIIRRDSEQRRTSITGRYIYAVTAPIVCEAVARVLDGQARTTGVVAARELFNAANFLAAPSPDPLSIQLC